MKPPMAMMLVLLLVTGMAGCGQKGPLYRPAVEATDDASLEAETGQTPTDHQQSESKDRPEY